MASRTLERACPLDCPDTCSLDVTVDGDSIVRIDGNARNPFTDGFICGKVRAYGNHVDHATRLLHPLIREPGSVKGQGAYRRASWDEALATIAARMSEARARHGGESILPCCFGGSNGKLTQDAVDAVLFRRLGASRLERTVCAAATTAAAKAVYGAMPGLALDDYENAALIVVWGANPQATGIHFLPPLRRALERGARLVVIDPRRTKTAKLAHLHLAPRPGTDLPLALAVVRWLFENGHADLEFLARHTTGAEALRERAAPWTVERAAAECGLDPADVERFARWYAESQPAALRCGWGLERTRNGCAAVAAVLTLPAVAGKFGRRAGGYTMSNGRAFPLHPVDAGAEPETRSINMNRLGRVLLEAEPPVDVLFVYNANPLATFPDQERLRRGLQRPGLFTVVFEQVMTDTARHADVVLPATTFLEHADLRNGYGAFALFYSEPAIAPRGEARPNYEVFAELLRRLGLERPGDDFSPVGLMRTALGHDAEAEAGLREAGIAFPAFGTRPVQFVDVFPGTPDRRVHLVPEALEGPDLPPLYTYKPLAEREAYPLALISPALASLVSSSLGELLEGEVAAALAPEDARRRGIADGDSIRLWNELGEVVTRARVDPDVRAGVVVLPKGLWSHHTRNGRTANALCPDDLEERAGNACFNDARIEVERLRGAAAGTVPESVVP